MKRFVCVLLMVVLITSGCWSRREVNDLGVVVTLGIDLTDDGLLEVTMGIAQPAAGTSSGGGGGGGSSGQPGTAGTAAKAVVSRTGRTLSEAIREAELVVPRRLTLHHVQVIIFGQRLAERGVNTLMDYLLRSPQVRLSAYVMVLRGASIKEILATQPIVEKLLAQVLRELASSRVGLVRNLRDFLVARSTAYQAPILPVITFEGRFIAGQGGYVRSPELAGAVIFHDDRATTYLDPHQARGAIWLIGSARDSIVTTACPGFPEKYISGRIYGAKREFTPLLRGSQLMFRVVIAGSLHITETQCPIDLLDLSQAATVDRALRLAMKQRIEDVIRITQAIPADPFPFGEYVRAYLPGVWEQVRDRWPETWASTPVEVVVKVKTTHVESATKVPNWRADPPIE